MSGSILPFSLAYNVIKDLAKIAKLKDGEDINAGRMSLDDLRDAGISGLDGNDDLYRWVSPRHILARTNQNTGAYDVVFVRSGFRERNRIVRYNSDGRIDLVLCKEQDA